MDKKNLKSDRNISNFHTKAYVREWQYFA